MYVLNLDLAYAQYMHILYTLMREAATAHQNPRLTLTRRRKL